MVRTCERCGYVASDSFYLARHLQRKKPCVATSDNAPTAAELLQALQHSRDAFPNTCAYCHKSFPNAKCSQQHRSRCAEHHGRTVKHIQGQLATLIQGNVTITNHITNHITQNVTVLPFGRENENYLHDSDLLLRCLRCTDAGVVRFLEQKHFHPEHPENHNVMATNVKMPFVKVCRSGGRWEVADKNAVIDDSVMQACNTLLDFFDDNRQAALERNGDQIDSFVTMLKEDEGIDRFAKKSRKDVFLMIINCTKKLNLKAET
jgi:hypothetical protein